MAPNKPSRPKAKTKETPSWTKQKCPGPPPSKARLGKDRLEWVHKNYKYAMPPAMFEGERFEKTGKHDKMCLGCEISCRLMNTLDDLIIEVRDGKVSVDEARTKTLQFSRNSQREVEDLLKRLKAGGVILKGEDVEDGVDGAFMAAMRWALIESVKLAIAGMKEEEAELKAEESTNRAEANQEAEEKQMAPLKKGTIN
ncbi:MAG: hypothetical protein M1828_002171 [Chrysothrix sp. TS-e1954]|nr:MAG: hypothetical protein M1828_002171 [Chrysothrix sp. TS-e1954]